MYTAAIAIGAILIAGVALFLYGRSTAKRAEAKRSEKVAHEALKTVKETEDEVKDMSDSDLNKHI